MSVVVVDLLDVIDVDRQQRQRTQQLVRAMNFSFHRFDEGSTAERVGQSVSHRDLIQLVEKQRFDAAARQVAEDRATDFELIAGSELVLTNRYVVDVAAVGRLKVLDLPASIDLRQPSVTSRNRVTIDLDVRIAAPANDQLIPVEDEPSTRLGSFQRTRIREQQQRSSTGVYAVLSRLVLVHSPPTEG